MSKPISVIKDGNIVDKHMKKNEIDRACRSHAGDYKRTYNSNVKAKKERFIW
jgi:hypothetical protein